MDIQPSPRANPISEDQQHLDRLQRVIEQATADGKLTQLEINRIKSIVWSDDEVSPEELEMVNKLVKEKIASGELAIEW